MSGLNPNAQKGKKKDPKVAATDNSGSTSSSASSPKKSDKSESGAAKAGSNTGRKTEPKLRYTSGSTAVGSSSGRARPSTVQTPPTQSKSPLDSLPKDWNRELGRIGQDLQTKHEKKRRPPKRNYSFGERIGIGSYAFVYECSDPEGGYYAVKTLKPECKNDQRAKELEAREEEILIFLRDHCKRHESIVEFHEAYDEPDVIEKKKLRTYFVFEELCGRSLASILRSGPIKIVDKIKRVSVQTLGGLQFLHENHIVHGDIKPENILFKTSDPKDYTIKIIDFGFSQRGPVYSNEIPTGTPIYRPPEGLVSPKFDIWGFGIILWEMFHGLDKFPIRPIGARIAMQEKKGPSDVVSKYMEERNEKEFEKELKFDLGEWKSNPKAVPLAKGILDKDPNKRLTAKQALELTWLNE